MTRSERRHRTQRVKQRIITMRKAHGQKPGKDEQRLIGKFANAHYSYQYGWVCRGCPRCDGTVIRKAKMKAMSDWDGDMDNSLNI